MKKAIWVMRAILVLSCAGYGQTAPPSAPALQPAHSKKGFSLKPFFAGFKKLTPRICLTKPQKDRVDALVKKTEGDEDQVEDNDKLDEPVRESRLDALHEQFEEQLFTILTPPQVKAYKEGCKQFLNALHLAKLKPRKTS